MQYQPSRRSFPLPTVVWALIIASSGFLLGRISVRLSSRPFHSSPASGDPHGSDTEPALQRAQTLRTSQSTGWRPTTRDWDDLAEASGLLQSRPPLEPGDTGSKYYVIQPKQVLSWHPRIVLLPNFIDQERAQSIIAAATARLHASQLALRKDDKADDKQQVRTSQGAFLSSHGDPTEGKALQWLDEKIAAVTNIPKQNFEAFNVLKYEKSQHYDSHHDYFQASMYGPQKSNRIATMLIYLEAPEEGGETVFPLEGINGEDNMKNFTYKTCDRGYLYKPRSGDAVLFWSVDTLNAFDKQSLHGGCPVVSGDKWVATKWMRDMKHG